MLPLLVMLILLVPLRTFIIAVETTLKQKPSILFSLNCLLGYGIGFAILLFTACAHVVSPDGGLRDKQPPQLVVAKPANESVRFNQKSISLHFDEYVQLKGQSDAILISPPQPKPPKITARNKTINVVFQDTLQANTTYSINFGEEIQDITEHNALHNFSYVFSTGNFIDSLQLNGRVTDAYTTLPVKDMLMVLYAQNNDSLPALKLPLYYTRTNEQGEWQLKHLKAGRFKLFALKDANANLLFDSPTEDIAFSDTLIQLEDPTPLTGNNKRDSIKPIKLVKYVSLRSFKNKTNKQRAYPMAIADLGHAIIPYTLPLDTAFSVEPLPNSKSKLAAYFANARRDTIHLYYNSTAKDSFYVRVITPSQIDTVGLELREERDTLLVKRKFKLALRTNLAQENSVKDKRKGAATVVAKPVTVLIPGQDLTVYFNHPIRNWKLASIRLLIDSQKTVLLTNEQLTKIKKGAYWTGFSIAAAQLGIKAHSAQVFIPKALVEDCYAQTNDSLSLQVQLKSTEELGNIKLNLSRMDPTAILYLLSGDGQVVFQTKLVATSFSVKNLLPGSYKIRIVTDKNGNGFWDSGDYFNHTQPEPVYLFPSEINMKPNWDMDLDVKW